MNKITQLVHDMIDITNNLQQSILFDIEDIKQANHEKLLDRNDDKQIKMDQLANLKLELNSALAEAIQAGEDVNKYKPLVDQLEVDLKELYMLNGKLASIVLPVRQMYREIVEDITAHNGGSLIEIKA
ncbi:MAG: hypothetical protein U9N30_11215 [Campylobacterota bacterium]|nr:hypothetical protein [Campylobacterota bacterium]